jgi:hypothetical protein
VNGYTIARLFHTRHPEISGRKVLAAIWASMNEDLQRMYLAGASDAEILRKAHELKLPGTGPYLEQHGGWQ